MKTHQKKKTAFPWNLQSLIPILLTAILIFAAFIRLTELATLPSTLNRDEAALAYNAYLLEKTGKDEWGRSWPVSLESFGDYKLPGYPMLLVAFFKVFGANDFAVRLPSALAGTLLVAVGYFFARRVLNLHPISCLIVAVTLALQPVFFFYSRMAWEANVALLFFATAVTLFFSLTQDKGNRQKLDIIALLLCLLAIFTYNTPLLLLPFVALALVIDRGVRQWRGWLLPFAGTLVIFAAGLFLFSSISQQKSGITVFSDETLWQQSVDYRNSFSGIAQKVLGNRYVFFGKVILQNYWKSFSPEFLIQKGGGHPWHNVPNIGHLFIATYLLALVGIGRLVWVMVAPKTNHASRLTALTLLFLLLTSLIPSVITVDSPHATRSLFFFFLLCTFSGVAIEWMWKLVSIESDYRYPLQVFFVLLFLFGIGNELHRYYFAYFSAYPKQSAEILKAGLGTQVQKMEERLGSSPDQVAIVDPDGFLYTEVAWDLKIPPEEFFSTINHHLPDRIGLKYGYRVGRYRFIVNRNDRVPEDTHLIEWDPYTNRWITDQNL